MALAAILLLLLAANATASSICASAKCSPQQACVSWRSAYALCVPVPPPNPACTCPVARSPVACRFPYRAGRSSAQGVFTANNACDCNCRGGTSAAAAAPPRRPVACPLVYAPVCCRVGAKLETKSNKCFCRSVGAVVSEDPCEPEPEQKICTQEYAPVCCRRLNGKTSTAGNRCECGDGTVLHDGECKTAGAALPKRCTREYAPVCCRSTSGATATTSNRCMCGDGTVLYDGKCKPAISKPTRICTLEYAPVCCRSRSGSTSTTGNRCQCGDGTVLYDGEC